MLRDGALDLAADARIGSDASLAWRVAAEAAYSGVPIAGTTLGRLGAERRRSRTPWTERRARRWCRCSAPADAMVPVFETLDRYGVIVRYLPEWDAVRSRPQRNAFHRFTVDRHLLEWVAQAGLLRARSPGRTCSCSARCCTISARAFPATTPTPASSVAGPVVARMGFAAARRRHGRHARPPAPPVARGGHRAATSTDPATVGVGGRRGRQRRVLELLAALTEADSIATGETAWSSWKAELLRALVARVRAVLLGEEHPEDATASDVAAELAARAAGGVLVEADGSTLHVVAPDRPGLLSTVVGLLVLHGQSVRSAQVWSTDDGAAVEEFELESRLGREADWARFGADLVDAIDGRRELGPTVAERSRTVRAEGDRRPAGRARGSSSTRARRRARRSSRSVPPTRSACSTASPV